MPLDLFQRQINYLRISVTDRCNLRCVYCMPMKGIRFEPHEQLLTPEEIGTVVRAAVRIGFHKFRITGGEPTLRRDIVEIVRQIRAVEGVEELAMTTNGYFLPRLGGQLVEAGLDRVNLHIDTLNDQRLRQVMRLGDLDKVWAGIEAAEDAGLTPLKLNTVVVRDLNDRDVVDLARLTVERGWHVRFIELMPLGGGECAKYSRDQFVSSAESRALIESDIAPLEPVTKSNPWDESRNYRFAGCEGIVGFISPVSQPFCGTCNRMRLTADGNLQLCLLKDKSLELRSVLRGGASAAEVETLLMNAVIAKPVGHELVAGVSSDQRSMHQIGG